MFYRNSEENGFLDGLKAKVVQIRANIDRKSLFKIVTVSFRAVYNVRKNIDVDVGFIGESELPQGGKGVEYKLH